MDEIIEPAGAQTPPWPSSGVFAGYYQGGIERRDFTPAGTTERWWLSGNIGGLGSGGRFYLTVRGTLSEIGEHGQAGLYRLELVVDQVIPNVRTLEQR